MGVISNLKEQKSNSENFSDYWKNANLEGKTSCYSKRPVIVISTLVLIAGPILEVIVGSLTLKACPALDILPIYCLGIGLISITSSVADAIARWRPADSEEELSTLGKIGKALQLLILLAMIGWFIAGNVWVFNMRPCTDIQLEELNNSAVTCYTTDVTYYNTSVYCNELVFGVAFNGVFIRWGIVALIIVVCSILCCPICCVYYWYSGSARKRNSENFDFEV